MKTVAIIGAGIAGATAAHLLHHAGYLVTVFDKSRGSGGRIASRQTSTGPVDHGTPYLELADTEVIRFLQPAMTAGVLRPWQPRMVQITGDDVRFTERRDVLTGLPGMSSLTRFLLQEVQLLAVACIVRCNRHSGGWNLEDEQGRHYGTFERLIVTTPPLQALPLLQSSPELCMQVQRAAMECCWVTVLQSGHASDAPFDVALCQQGPLCRLVRHDAKPGHPAGTVWQLQASAAWSQEHRDDGVDQVAAALLDAAAEIGVVLPETYTAWAHRWLYGFTAVPVGSPYLFDRWQCLGVCGDWLLGRSVEDAVKSALQMVGAMKG